MTTDVNGHRQLEEEHPLGIEGAEGGQEAHGSAPIRQHVQHGAKLGRLVEHPRGVAIKGVQEPTDDVTPSGRDVVRWHEPERQNGQKDSGVSNQVWHEHKDVLPFFFVLLHLEAH